MSKEKQIEGIARIICADSANKGLCEKCGFNKGCWKFKDAESIYNAGYRKQEWISVMDELPETYIDVLYFDGQSIGVDFICSDGTWCDEEVRNNKATHWMPLPEAPKMKGGAE